MMFRLSNGVSNSIFFLFLILAVLLSAVTAISDVENGAPPLEQSTVPANMLPGVTWADDIHPIFIRNKCHNCHTRGKEDLVEGFLKFALGIVDANDPGNPYYSFHELVYTEGPPNIIEGEDLRDGQCCWPRDFKSDQQRRIWLGHPERSVLMRKLDRDYYDWNKPPRYLEEGLRLTWGLPMPLWTDEDKENEQTTQENTDDKSHGHESTHTPSLWREIILRVMLLFDQGQDKLNVLEKPVPAVDRALLREWINNTVQLRTGGTAINIKLTSEKGRTTTGKKISLIGNFVVPSHTKIQETFIVETDDGGIASLKFPVGSVVSLAWYAGILDEHENYHYQAINITPGEINDLIINE
ncbi:MAG: hypothetical protein ABFS18_08070 [Thermodesulfobacteriota bacterium]